MIYVVQLLIIYAVIAANIHWQATPNPLIPSAAGVGLAYVLTVWLPSLFSRRSVPLQDQPGGDGASLRGVSWEPGEALEQRPRRWIGNDPG